MRLEIDPYRGIGPIRFGMPPEQVRSILGFPYAAFLKSADSPWPTDAFDTLGLHIYYKSPGICEAVECFLPAEPLLWDQPLLGRPFNEVSRWIEGRSANVVPDAAGMTALDVGIALCCPAPGKNPAERIESVLVFERGYYS